MNEKTYYLVTMGALYCTEFDCEYNGGVTLKKVAFSPNEREAKHFESKREADEVGSAMKWSYGADCAVHVEEVNYARKVVAAVNRD